MNAGLVIGFLVVHFASPAARFRATALDKLLEALEIALDAPRDDPQCRGDLLDQLVRLVFHPHANPSMTGIDRRELNDAAVGCAGNAAPSDAVVRNLFGDFSIPFELPATDFGAPVEVRSVHLLHRR